MRLSSLLGSVAVLSLLVGCATAGDESSSSSEAAQTAGAEAPALDCTKPGSYPEAAMMGLDGAYERVGVTPGGGLRAFTIGPLQDIAGWGGKNATYTRDMEAPCLDIVAAGDFSTMTAESGLPMTSSACAGQRGTITTLPDNPAIGAFLAFDDASGLPAGKEVYFITSSLLDASGKLSAMCLGHAGTGETFLVARK